MPQPTRLIPVRCNGASPPRFGKFYSAVKVTMDFGVALQRHWSSHDDERQPFRRVGGDGESEGGFRVYASASEVVREALRLMEHQDQLRISSSRNCVAPSRAGWTAASRWPGTRRRSKPPGATGWGPMANPELSA